MYKAPELLRGRPYGMSADIHSLGCCIFEISTLKRAFDTVDDILNGNSNLFQSTEPLTNVFPFVEAMLRPIAAERPTAAEILGGKL